MSSSKNIHRSCQCGICKVCLQNKLSYLLAENQLLLDDDPADQSEVLFQPHQLCAHMAL